MSHRTLRLALLVTLIATTATRAFAADQERLNVLFIASDDLRPELGCYGNERIKTPNIDRLAARATRFDRCYCQYPLCNPSRSSLLTGRYPTTTGVLDNTVWFRDAHPDFVSLPQHFKANGYLALRTGKIFHGGIDDTAAWTEGGEERRPEKPGAPRRKQDPSKSDRIVVLEGDGQSHNDYQTATRAIELLNKHRDQPFFLACGFTKPHSPPTAPQIFFDLYRAGDMPLPPDFAAEPVAPAGFPKPSIPERNGDLFISRPASREEAQEVIRAYYASASFMDAQVGRVLDELDRLGLRDKTIVFFWGDHGYHLGEKGKWSKHRSLFEVGDRVPLLVALPQGKPQSIARTVQLLDMYPTLVELCRLPSPGPLEGHSLVPLLNDPAAAWNHPAFTVADLGNKTLARAVRTERWRYVEYDEGRAGAMLFDEQADPHELRNLASDPAHAEIVEQMKGLLEQIPPLAKR